MTKIGWEIWDFFLAKITQNDPQMTKNPTKMNLNWEILKIGEFFCGKLCLFFFFFWSKSPKMGGKFGDFFCWPKSPKMTQNGGNLGNWNFLGDFFFVAKITQMGGFLEMWEILEIGKFYFCPKSPKMGGFFFLAKMTKNGWEIWDFFFLAKITQNDRKMTKNPPKINQNGEILKIREFFCGKFFFFFFLVKITQNWWEIVFFFVAKITQNTTKKEIPKKMPISCFGSLILGDLDTKNTQFPTHFWGIVGHFWSCCVILAKKKSLKKFQFPQFPPFWVNLGDLGQKNKIPQFPTHFG